MFKTFGVLSVFELNVYVVYAQAAQPQQFSILCELQFELWGSLGKKWKAWVWNYDPKLYLITLVLLSYIVFDS